MPLGPPGDPDRFDDFDECVDALTDDPDLSEADAERICGAWEQDTTNAMTDTDDPEHRAYHQPDPDRVELRQDLGDDEDGVFSVRMPIASTGDVRNEGDEPLSRDAIEGMATQIDDRSVGVFLDHGSNPDIAGSRYSATGKVGEWQAPDVETRDGAADELVAEARLMDPETLPAAAGSVREALATLKEQVKRDIPLSASIGWREADDFPGGNDLMEASIVGIPADPRTTSQDAAAALARAAADARPDVDAEQLVADFRAVVMGPDADDRHLSEQQADRAIQVLNAYRDEQGNGSVGNFESWLWGPARGRFDDEDVHAAMTALDEFFRETTPLEEPVTSDFVPFLDGRQDDGTETNDMTDDNDGDGDGADPDDTNESDDMDAQEYRESMLEMQEQQTETLETLAEAIREDDDDEDDDDDDMDENEGDDEDEEDDEDDENAADTQSLDVDGDEVTVDDVREMREQLADAEPAGVTDADDGDESDEDDRDVDAPDDAAKNLLKGT